MRWASRGLVFLAVLGLLGPSAARTTVISKDNNTTNLNVAGSWVGGSVPGSLDVAQWNATVTAANTVLLGGDLSWLGIAVVNPGGAVTINAGNTLTLGSSGIDLSTAAQNLTLNNAVALGAGQTWNVNAGRTLAVSGTVSGTSGLIKDGAGTLSLTGSLTYAGDTTNGDTFVNGGTLSLAKSTLFPSAGSTGQFSSAHKVVVNSGATLQLNSAWVTGDGVANRIEVNGGTLQFNADNYQSNITLTGGAITTAGTGAPWRTGNFGPGVITVNASASSSTISGLLCFVGTTSAPTTTFDVADGAAADDLVVSARIFDHAGFEGKMLLVKSGPGVMVMTGDVVSTGGIRIDGGTLRLAKIGIPTPSAGGELGSGQTVTVNSGATLDLATAWVIGNGQANQVVVNGGTLKFSMDNYLSRITLNGGTITATGGIYAWRTGNYGDGLITVLANSNSSVIQGSLVMVKTAAATKTTFDVADGAATDDLVMSANILDHPGGYEGMELIKTGAGKMVLSGAGTYAGPTTINGGMLQLSGGNNRLPTATALTLANVAGVILDLNSLNQTIGSLSGGGATGGNITLGSGTLTVGNTSNTTFSGEISGTGSLVKQGSGTLTLNSAAANAMSGSVTVNAGTLKLAGTGGRTFNNGYFQGQATVYTINSSGTLDVAANWNTSNIATYNVNGGTINISVGGDANYINNLTMTGGAITGTGAFRTGYFVNPTWTINGSASGSAISAPVGLVLGTGTTLTFNVADGGAAADLTVSNSIYDVTGYAGMNLAKSGAGTMVLSGASTYVGATAINGGTLQLAGGNNRLPTGTAVTLGNVAGAVLDLNGLSQTIGSLSGGGGTGGTVALGSGTLTVGNAASTTYSGTITGTAASGLVKQGAGTLTLNSGAANTMSGSVTVDAGTLRLAAARLWNEGYFQNLATTYHINAGGTLEIGADWNSSTVATYDVNGGTLRISSGIAADGNTYVNNLAMTGGSVVGNGIRVGYTFNNTWTIHASATGATISAPLRLVKGDGGANVATVFTIDVADGAADADLAITGTISDLAPLSGLALAKAGAGKMVLSATNTYTGVTRLNGGVTEVAALTAGTTPGPLGAASGYNSNIVFDGGTLRYTGPTTTWQRAFTLNAGGGTIDVASADATLTLSPNFLDSGLNYITGPGGLTKLGPGTLVLAPNSASGTVPNFTGGMTVNGGTLRLAAGGFNNGILHGTATVNNGGTLDVAAAFPVNGTDTINVNGGGIFNASTAAGQDPENYIGTVNLDSSNGLAAQVTTTTGSGFRMGNIANGLITSTGPVANSWSAELRLVNGGSRTVTIDTAVGNTLLMSGAIRDYSTLPGTPLYKTGDGTLVLSAANTYAGATTVNAGTLLVDGSIAGSATVAGGLLGGNGSIGGGVTVAGGTISAGDSPGLLSIGGSYAQSGGTLLAEISDYDPGIDGYDQIAVGGSATLGGTVDVVTLDGFMPAVGAEFDILTAVAGITNGDLAGVSFTSSGTMLPATFWVPSIVTRSDLGTGAEALRLTVGVPEPSALVLAALGLAGLALYGWRRRSSRPITE
jgi:fibronectin-binding autotransporter adhesin